MAKKKPVDPIEGEATQDQVVEETATEETTTEQSDATEEVGREEPKPEKPMQIGKDGNPILPAEEHVKNWGVMTKVPFGQKDELGESE
jgi:hypothetical protein